MQYEDFKRLRSHPAWRLLAADHAPLILSFFHRAFIRSNRRAIAAGELTALLDDHLHHLREVYGADFAPRPPQEYLDNWASGQEAFLRKYYPEKGDEPEYDLTPASEKVLEWLTDLEPKQFVGTESRLLAIFRLLREIVRDTAVDPQEQIAALEIEKKRIEAEIARLRQGQIPPRDATRVRERFLLVDDTARHLLFDFRQIEENFRGLDRLARERIAIRDRSKGDLLDEIFGEEDTIRGSDQGRSFRAFWAYLMSPVSQTELDRLTARVLDLPEVQGLDAGAGLERLRFDLLEAGEKVNATCARLVEQLRKFLDDQTWLENRRIMAIVRDIEKNAVLVRQSPPPGFEFHLLDQLRPGIDLPMARGLFRPARPARVDDAPGPGVVDFATPALYRQHHVDEARLKRRIRRALRGRAQVSLAELCRRYPVEKGLSEVIAYLHIACNDERAAVDTARSVAVAWTDAEGRRRTVHMPEVIFTA